ncbi:hypothetical protein PoMZ_05040 [Pyricularia oryzae]|uniref:Uncharacterized protein n=1 Tax=Pyricularia oryzae TaxID=318829 RepID=A0A4P7NE24_PYROR|nr:hypothetical protein PoMZ_05040 [Pyricularia oryzae]
MATKDRAEKRLWGPKIGKLREFVFFSADSKKDNGRPFPDVAPGAFVNDLSDQRRKARTLRPRTLQPYDFRGHNILLLSDSDSDRDDCPEESIAAATGPERQRYSVLGDGDKKHKRDGKPKKTQAEIEVQKDQAELLPLIYGQDSNEKDFLAKSAVEEKLVNDIVKLLPDRPRADSPTLGTDGAIIRRNCRYKNHGKAFHYH